MTINIKILPKILAHNHASEEMIIPCFNLICDDFMEILLKAVPSIIDNALTNKNPKIVLVSL